MKLWIAVDLTNQKVLGGYEDRDEADKAIEYYMVDKVDCSFIVQEIEVDIPAQFDEPVDFRD